MTAYHPHPTQEAFRELCRRIAEEIKNPSPAKVADRMRIKFNNNPAQFRSEGLEEHIRVRLNSKHLRIHVATALNYEKKSKRNQVLAGSNTIGGGVVLPKEGYGRQLLNGVGERLQALTKQLYPKLHQCPEDGSADPSYYVRPLRMAQDLWCDAQTSSEQGDSCRFASSLTLRKERGLWRVKKKGSYMIYVQVDSEKAAKFSQLKAKVTRILDDSELKEYFAKMRDAKEKTPRPWTQVRFSSG